MKETDLYQVMSLHPNDYKITYNRARKPFHGKEVT